MATTNLSNYNPDEVPSGKGKKVTILVSEWNIQVTGNLLKGALDTLKKYEVREEDITVKWVPGSFELIYGAASVLADFPNPSDGIIALGAIVRGETPHFDYIAEATTVNLGHLNTLGANAKYGTEVFRKTCPVIMGVLTTDTMQQALDRSGGIHGNKGVEGAVTLLKMMDRF